MSRSEQPAPGQRLERLPGAVLGIARRILISLTRIAGGRAGIVIERQPLGIAPVRQAGAMAQRHAHRQLHPPGIARQVGIAPVVAHRFVQRQRAGRHQPQDDLRRERLRQRGEIIGCGDGGRAVGASHAPSPGRDDPPIADQGDRSALHMLLTQGCGQIRQRGVRPGVRNRRPNHQRDQTAINCLLQHSDCITHMQQLAILKRGRNLAGGEQSYATALLRSQHEWMAESRRLYGGGNTLDVTAATTSRRQTRVRTERGRLVRKPAAPRPRSSARPVRRYGRGRG